METVVQTMGYTEALKKVSVQKKDKDNYLVIEVSYDMKLLLPYAAGLVLMQALGSAEKLNDSYSEQIHISGLDRSNVKTTILSSEEYSQIKIAELLQVKLEDVKRMKLAA